MTPVELLGWDRLRHGGLLLDAPRLRRVAEPAPDALPAYEERELRRFAIAALDGSASVPEFVSFVLDKVCGFTAANGTWQRGSQMGAEWGRRAVTGETIKPRQLWRGQHNANLPVFFDTETRLGIGRGRKSASQTVQWLRAGSERLALLTNGRQWRLIFAGLDFDAWCEWDVDLWFEEGALSPQVHALRTLFSPKLWMPPAQDAPAPLLQAILDSRKGQAELSAVLGERVREAVELLVQGHGEVLKEQCAGVDPADIYRAAVRVVMRMVVVLFAESRELLPRDNALYHRAYGLTGLLEELEKIAARGGNRLARSWNAWPRLLALFRLVHQGSHHPALPVPAYGGELFALGDSNSLDGLSRALAVFETAAFDREILPDREVHRLLERITRTKVKVRQGRASIWVPAPVDFSDLSSEYIGILYEGLLDFELKTAPAGDPVVFLAVGNQPALPLSRLDAMDDQALANLLEKMKDTSTGDDETGDGEVGESPDEEAAAFEQDGEPEGGEEPAGEIDAESQDEADVSDERHITRTRAETWARRAVEVCKLAKKPKGAMTPEKRLFYEDAVARKARQLVVRVMLPGEWYVVRWGGTRKGSGTFYTRPGLAVPTVHRTLRPLAYTPPTTPDGAPDLDAPSAAWIPKTPEEILALKVCDPGGGSGTFPVAALRFLTEALFASLHHHGRVSADGERAVVRLLADAPASANTPEERLGQELLPCRPDDALFEPRLKAILRRHVVERCIYAVDLDPLAVELCRLALWIETMDRTLPFSFLDHKVKCGNSLLGAWFDTFQHYPAMAWKNREGGDKGHSNGVHFEKEARTKAIKEFVKGTLTPDLAAAISGQTVFTFSSDAVQQVHEQALALLQRLHDLPVQDSAERARLYREELLGSPAYCSLKAAMDLWCACWFWPADDLEHAPLPTSMAMPPDKTRAIAERVAARKRFFHWELEFPDVFRAPGSGFDAMVGNPPWDIAKPNSKEFFSNIDPLYRSYGKQEALRYQTSYFADEEIERAWLDYNADFRAQSNTMGYVASPFGDPIENEKSQDRFSIVRGGENDMLHARWRSVRAKSGGFVDTAHPFRHQGSADLNLYKAFLEQAHALLRVGGRLGFIVPSGLYSDHGTGGLRQLFLDRCRWEWLFGFENRDKIFEIDSRFKFNPVIIEKGGKTEAIRTAFMRRKLEDWEHAEGISRVMSRDKIQKYSRATLSLLEIRDDRDEDLADRFYNRAQFLGDYITQNLESQVLSELHKTNDSRLFLAKREVDALRAEAPMPDFRDPRTVAWLYAKSLFPVYEGKNIHMFNNCWAEPTLIIPLASILEWFEKKGKREGGAGVTVFAAPRIVFREVARPTDERSMIATVLPPFSMTTYTLRAIPVSASCPWWLLGLFNSFAFDSLTRMRGNLHLSTCYSLLPVRRFTEEVETLITTRVRALLGPFLAGYGNGSNSWALDSAARTRARAEIEALAAYALGLNAEDVGHLLRDDPTDPIGFWRVDKDAEEGCRLPVLARRAFALLQQHGVADFESASRAELKIDAGANSCVLSWSPQGGWADAYSEAQQLFTPQAHAALASQILGANSKHRRNGENEHGLKVQGHLFERKENS